MAQAHVAARYNNAAIAAAAAGMPQHRSQHQRNVTVIITNVLQQHATHIYYKQSYRDIWLLFFYRSIVYKQNELCWINSVSYLVKNRFKQIH